MYFGTTMLVSGIEALHAGCKGFYISPSPKIVVLGPSPSSSNSEPISHTPCCCTSSSRLVSYINSSMCHVLVALRSGTCQSQ